MSYVTDEYPILAITATSIRVVTTAIDLRKFERFSILFNNNTAIAFTELQAQISINATVPDSAADVAQDWIAANSSIIPTPSALAATASVLTSAIDNSYRWIRFLARTGSTATAGSARIVFGGFRKY